MGNICRVSSRYKLTPKKIVEDIREILKRRFDGVFDVRKQKWEEYTVFRVAESEKGWFYTIDWFREGPKTIGAKHPHGGDVMPWVFAVLYLELAYKWKGRIRDESEPDRTFEGKRNPYPAFDDWLEGHGPQYRAFFKANLFEHVKEPDLRALVTKKP